MASYLNQCIIKWLKTLIFTPTLLSRHHGKARNKIFSDKTSHDIPNERLATSANYAANEALITDKVDFDDEIEDVTPPDMKAECRTEIFRTFRNGF